MKKKHSELKKLKLLVENSHEQSFWKHLLCVKDKSL